MKTLLVLLFATCVFAAGIRRVPLQEPDEGRYADISAAMARPGGDLVTPHLNGIPYFEKPPLFFWLAGASFQAFGETEWAARLPSVLGALFSVAMTMLLGQAAFGPRTGRMAGLILATSPLLAVLAHACIVDVVLLGFLTGALVALFHTLVTRPPDRPPRRPVVIFYLFVGLAVLTKGPIGFAIPLTTAVVYSLLARDRRGLAGLLWPGGLALCLAIAAPWFVMVSMRNADFAHAFFVEENLQRFFTGGGYERQGPLWYYLAVVSLGFLPWTFALPAARNFRRCVQETPRARSARLFLVAATLGPLLLLTAAQSKLAYYALPLLPPLALLVSQALVTEEAYSRATPVDARRRCSRVCAAAALTSVAAAGAIIWILQAPEERLIRLAFEGALQVPKKETQLLITHSLQAILLPALAGFLTLAAGGLLASYLSRRRTPEAGIISLACVLGVVSIAAPFVALRAEQAYSERPLAVTVSKLLRADDTIVLYDHYYRTLPFYLKRPVVLWSADPDEFGHRLTLEQAHGRAVQRDVGAFRSLLQGEHRVVIVAKDLRSLDELAALAPAPLYELGRYGSRRIMATRP